MESSPRRMGPLFYAAFALLSAATLVLLVFSVLLLTSTPILGYLKSWAVEEVAQQTAPPPPHPPASVDHQPAYSAVTGSSAAATGRDAVMSPPEGEPDTSTAQAAGTDERPLAVTTSIPIEDLRINGPIPKDLEKAAQPEKPAVPQGQLSIPLLEISLPAQRIPVREYGWDISQLREQVGWLETTGTHPDDDLAMVFIGHVTLDSGSAGPFLFLQEMKVGDEVLYQDDLALYTYQIDKVETIAPNAVEAVYIREKHKLALLTCARWNAAAWRYDRRLLVEAKLVRIERFSAANP